jgi:hypothetical protein
MHCLTYGILNMSTLYPTIEIEYHKRKPSKAVIMRTLGEYLKQGGKSFTITWGENQIDIDYHPGQEQWYGGGHIKNISGWDIAIELNAKETRNTLNLWNT